MKAYADPLLFSSGVHGRRQYDPLILRQDLHIQCNVCLDLHSRKNFQQSVFRWEGGDLIKGGPFLATPADS